MQAGQLNQLLTIQQRQVGLDAAGQESTTWVDVDTAWAEVLPLRGRDFIAAAQAQATFDAKVTMRWRADVSAGMRLLWKGQPLEIVGEPIDVKGRGAWLELMCSHGVRAGA